MFNNVVQVGLLDKDPELRDQMQMLGVKGAAWSLMSWPKEREER